MQPSFIWLQIECPDELCILKRWGWQRQTGLTVVLINHVFIKLYYKILCTFITSNRHETGIAP